VGGSDEEIAEDQVRYFRKKPLVVRAFQWKGDEEVLNRWLEAVPPPTGGLAVDTNGQLRIRTLEGTMYANEGDWIIQGVQGEFYACKPDIFEATYEEVTHG